MPLTQEQFQKARSSGFSTEQIIGFEQKRQSEKPPLQFKTEEDARKGQIQARNEQGLAKVNSEGIFPYVNAIGETAVRMPSMIGGTIASVASGLQKGKPQEILGNIEKTVTGQPAPSYKSVYKDAGVPENIAGPAGFATDIALFPGGARSTVELGKAGVGLLKSGAKAIGEGSGKAVKYVTDAFTGEAKANIAKNEAKFNLNQSTLDKSKSISDTANKQVGEIQTGQNAVNKGYQELESKLKGQIALEADKQGLNVQKDLPELFKKKSKEYAAKQSEILKSLTDNERNIPTDKIVGDMENTLLKFRILKKDPVKGLIQTDVQLTPAENKVVGLFNDLKNSGKTITTESPILGESGKPIRSIVEPPTTISAEDLIGHKQFIRPSAPKYGQLWGSDEKLQSEISEVFAKHTPEALRSLDREYQPFMELKDAATSKLDPYAGKYDVATGALSKSGTESMVSSGQTNASEQRLFNDLNSEIGKKIQGKIPGMQKRLSSLPDQKAMIENASTEAIKKIRKDAADEIFRLRKQKKVSSYDIDQTTARLVHQYQTRKYRIYGGVALASLSGAANSLKNFLKSELHLGVGANQ